MTCHFDNIEFKSNQNCTKSVNFILAHILLINIHSKKLFYIKKGVDIQYITDRHYLIIILNDN